MRALYTTNWRILFWLSLTTFWPRAPRGPIPIFSHHFATISCSVWKSRQFPSCTAKSRPLRYIDYRKLLGCCRTVIRQSLGSHWAVAGQSPGSRWAVAGQLPGSRESSNKHTVMRQSLQKIKSYKAYKNLQENLVYLGASDITKISRSSTRKCQIEGHGCKEYSQYMFNH